MNSVPIKVGRPVSCDYAFPDHPLPRINEPADRIPLAIDPACRTWTGTPFQIEGSLGTGARSIDVHEKSASAAMNPTDPGRLHL